MCGLQFSRIGHALSYSYLSVAFGRAPCSSLYLCQVLVYCSFSSAEALHRSSAQFGARGDVHSWIAFPCNLQTLSLLLAIATLSIAVFLTFLHNARSEVDLYGRAKRNKKYLHVCAGYRDRALVCRSSLCLRLLAERYHNPLASLWDDFWPCW